MKYDVFMWTRTFDRDYEWINKPDYVPTGLNKTCQSIMALTDKESFYGLSEDDWYSNFFYLRMKGCCLLARLARTMYGDADGNSIISFEGVSVKAEDERRLFCNLPSLINEFLPPARSFRQMFEEEQSMPDTFSTDNILTPFCAEVPDDIHPAVIHNPAFRNLMKFTAFTSQKAGFMFGNHARAFAVYVNQKSLGVDYIFDFENPDPIDVDEGSFINAYTPLQFKYNPPTATGKDKVAISLAVQETSDSAFKYRWVVMPWEAKEGTKVRYSTKFYDISDRVELARLELQKEAIKKFLIANGWTKEQHGLRFEKDTFQR
jgi:hypothetical protein